MSSSLTNSFAPASAPMRRDYRNSFVMKWYRPGTWLYTGSNMSCVTEAPNTCNCPPKTCHCTSISSLTCGCSWPPLLPSSHSFQSLSSAVCVGAPKSKQSSRRLSSFHKLRNATLLICFHRLLVHLMLFQNTN